MKSIKFKANIITVLFISIISSSYGQNNITKIERSIPYIQGQDVHFEIDYADKINISYWDKDSIEIVALVDLVDANGKSKNNDFDLQIENKNANHNIRAKVLQQNVHYVLKKSGSDHNPKGAFSDKILVVGTQVNLKIPKNANLEIKVVSMGDIDIDHNGKGLLVSTNGSISLNIEKTVRANFQLSSLYGEISVDDRLTIMKSQPEDNSNNLSSRKEQEFILNSGGETFIALTAFGDITILTKNK